MEIIPVYYYLLAILLLLLSLTPLVIYLRYGREPKIDYNTEYETELPTDDPPAIVNAICAGNPKKIGVANLDGFRATILDLIDRNYLIINNGDAYSDSLLLEINPDYDHDSLWEFEEMVINFLREYEQGGVISMDLISKSLNYDEDAAFFKVFYKNWRGEVLDCLLEENNFEGAFHSRGDDYLKAFGYLGIIVSFVLMKSESGFIFLPAFILLASSVVSLILPQKIAGQWTPYGREYYEKWKSFKRYIEDYSLINNYSPESVKVWDKYLIYGTALGAANGVRKAMELSLPDNKRKKDSSYLCDAADAFEYVLHDAVNGKPKSK